MIALLALGCSRPPPAPAGLTDSLRFLLRDFHADDDTVGAGLTGLLDWFDADGDELADSHADIYSVGAFQLGELEPADVARLPVEGDPDPRLAPGVVSVSRMRCGLSKAQDLLVRPDQDVVFGDPWKAYDRHFDTGRRPFEDADLGEVARVEEEIPEDALAEQPDALLLTENAVESSKLGITMDFDLVLRFRHGTFDVQGEPTEALLVLGFFPHRAVAGSGDALNQSWSIEADVARPDHQTLRVFGAWSELDSALLPADSPYVLTEGVNDAQATSERMSEICSGELALPPER